MTALRWLPFALLAALALWYGLRAGDRWRVTGETEAIARAAARYVREVPGGRPEDCAARPIRGGNRLLVACGRRERLRLYEVDRRGRVVRTGPGGT